MFQLNLILKLSYFDLDLTGDIGASFYGDSTCREVIHFDISKGRVLAINGSRGVHI